MMMLDDGAPRGSLRFDADRVRRFTSVEPRLISLHSLMQPERRRVEAYIEAAYASAFNGTIRAHYPTLMSVQDGQGRIHGAVGFRLADNGALFLEQYLDEPVEAAIHRRSGETVDRSAVAEIGSLASESAGASLFMFLALARHLHHKGCTHAAATATRQLRRSFARVGFATQTLTRAEPSRLGDGAADWGGYYNRDPEVMIGAIAPALPALTQMLMVEPPEVPDIRPRLHPAWPAELIG
ncbi:thermostable hemolysin [Caulobacter henricii]|uniref:thermostable hemolysin n=1 Tax=Caulobacter henricii TaxID=69395 RepID=UPI001F1CD519|nr:thermostable hemolysin [Caulobacter henricii]